MSHKSSKVVSITPRASTPAIVEDYLTAKQVADRLHVKVATIYEWTRRRAKNPIPNYPISRKVVLFKWSEVVDWIEAQRVAA